MADTENTIRALPLLPMKNTVLFPGLVMPLAVGRSGSIAAVEAAMATEDGRGGRFAMRVLAGGVHSRAPPAQVGWRCG